MNERLDEVSIAHIDIGSFEIVDTGWVSQPHLLRLLGNLLRRQSLPTTEVIRALARAAGTVNPALETLADELLLPTPALEANPDSLLLTIGQLAELDPLDQTKALLPKMLLNRYAEINRLSASAFGWRLENDHPEDGPSNPSLELYTALLVKVLYLLLRDCAADGSPLQTTLAALARTLEAPLAYRQDSLEGFTPPTLMAQAGTQPQTAAPSSIPKPALTALLSPIGLYKVYRQYFIGTGNVSTGRAQHVLSLAPGESVEVVTQSTRRKVREDEAETTSEQESERSSESKDLSDMTDMLSNVVSKTTSASLSANASGVVGVMSFGVSASLSAASAESTSTQSTSRRMRELTTKTVDRLKRSVRIKTRNVQEFTDVNSSRRTIGNPGPDVMNVVAHQAVEAVRAVVQDISTQLCWRCTIDHPGAGLRLSLLEPSPLASKIVALDQRGADVLVVTIPTTISRISGTFFEFHVRVDLPAGRKWDGDETGIVLQKATAFARGWDNDGWVGDKETLQMKVMSATSLSLNANGKELSGIDVVVRGVWTVTPYNNGVTIEVAIRYGFSSTPTPLTPKEMEEAALQRLKHLEGQRTLKTRIPQDLRDEERAEVVQRVWRDAFGLKSPDAGDYTLVNELFDFDALFYSLPEHLLAALPSGPVEPTYTITTETSPAPFGSSLSWEYYQWDADRVRNVLLNVPFATVCVPLKAGREADALEWLQKQVDGRLFGQLHTKDALAGIVSSLSKRREAEMKLYGPDGPPAPGDVDATAHCPLPADLARTREQPETIASIAELFPLVDRFTVQVPVDGVILRKVLGP